MLVFIDESGDTGLKLDKGSSRYFVITVLFFEDDDEALKCDEAISKLRNDTGLKSEFEFHFCDASRKNRNNFLNETGKFNYFYVTVVIDKKEFKDKDADGKENFYKYACGLVLEHSKPYLDNAKVILDGSGSKNFRLQLAAYLRKKINDGKSTKIKKVKIQDSKKNNLIQLADMVCGAVARSFSSEAKDKDEYRKIIKLRELGVHKLPNIENE